MAKAYGYGLNGSGQILAFGNRLSTLHGTQPYCTLLTWPRCMVFEISEHCQAIQPLLATAARICVVHVRNISTTHQSKLGTIRSSTRCSQLCCFNEMKLVLHSVSAGSQSFLLDFRHLCFNPLAKRKLTMCFITSMSSLSFMQHCRNSVDRAVCM